uniref:Serpin domain-containing protein n=1 Tax=Panagrolaimus davidi TaxID=227884 RepID=A0A914Q1W8_9BILA
MSLKSEIKFSTKFLNLLYSPDKPTIYAPSILLNSLAMIFAGCDGITAEEIAEIIGKEKNCHEIIEYYSNLIHYCKTVDDGLNWEEEYIKSRQVCYKLLLSNRLFVSNKKILSSKWKKIMDEKFDSEFESVDFDNKVEAVDKMNNFVKEKTEGHISKIVDENDINPPLTVLFLINALCFQGFWMEEFDDPKLQNFYSKNGNIREIEMITKDAHMKGWNLTEGEDWQCLGIPFKTYQSWFHILLPNKNVDLKDLIDKLDYTFIQKCIKTQKVDKVIATIPAFHIESDIDLKEILQKMGLTNAFKGQTDAHGINKIFEDDRVFISKAIHKAGMKVRKLL